MLKDKGLNIEAHLDGLLSAYEAAEIPPLPRPKKVSIKPARVKTGDKEVLVENAVEIDPVVMQRLQNRIDKYSSSFAERLFKDMLPLLVSYSCGTNYVKAAALEGMGLDIDFDQSIGELVKQIGALSVAYHFVRNSKIPRKTRQQFMQKFTENLAVRSADQLFLGQSAKRRMMQELQALVGTKSDGKTTVFKRDPDAPPSPGLGSMRGQR